ncbi:MAG: flagellar hook assembly protein FlgD [Alphaproteobacteria bacterium]|nr:flagellar hook assembly protein FlgD [Alphaproteobacteria bacterium]
MTAATTLTKTDTSNPLAKYQAQPVATTTDSNKTALNKLTDDYTTFLKLLTTQLQNQDPTAPMDSSQFTQQLVQYSQVEQQIKSNQKLDTLISNQNNAGVGSSLGYLGKTIEMDGSQFNYDANGASFNYSLANTASQVTIQVYDASGTLVRTDKTASGILGKHTLTWDGKDDSGNALSKGLYTVNVTATDSSGNPVTTKVSTNGKVDGVEKDSTGAVVLDVGKIQVNTTQILGIHDTTTAATTTAAGA